MNTPRLLLIDISPPLLFALTKIGLSPGSIFLCVGLPLEIMATLLYLTRVLFSLLITDEGIYLFLNATYFYFLNLIRLTELFLARGRSTRKINH